MIGTSQEVSNGTIHTFGYACEVKNENEILKDKTLSYRAFLIPWFYFDFKITRRQVD